MGKKQETVPGFAANDDLLSRKSSVHADLAQPVQSTSWTTASSDWNMDSIFESADQAVVAGEMLHPSVIVQVCVWWPKKITHDAKPWTHIQVPAQQPGTDAGIIGLHDTNRT